MQGHSHVGLRRKHSLSDEQGHASGGQNESLIATPVNLKKCQVIPTDTEISRQTEKDEGRTQRESDRESHREGKQKNRERWKDGLGENSGPDEIV